MTPPPPRRALTPPIAAQYSGVYKEGVFNKVSMDVAWVNLWVALFQVTIGIFLAPLQRFPMFGGVHMNEIPGLLADGARCYWGTQVPRFTNTVCPLVFRQVNLYMMFNLSYNTVLLMCIKFGSAALFYVASTTVLPLANICFNIPFFVGKQIAEESHFDVTDIISFFIIIAGLITYRVTTPSAGEQTDKEEDTATLPQVAIGGAGPDVTYRRSTLGSSMSNGHAGSRAGLYGKLGLPTQRAVKEDDFAGF